MSVYKVNKKRTKNLYIYIQPITKEEETVKTVRRNDVIKEEEEGTLKNNERTMRGLNWAEPSLSLPVLLEFYSPWKENKVYTPLGLETIKVSGIDLKRRCWPRTTQQHDRGKEGKRRKEGKGDGGREGCYERCVQLTWWPTWSCRTTGHGGS